MQAIIFRHGFGKAVPSLLIWLVYLWPWRRQEDVSVIAVSVKQSVQVWLVRDMLERGGGIDQPTVEEHPAR